MVWAQTQEEKHADESQNLSYEIFWKLKFESTVEEIIGYLKYWTK